MADLKRRLARAAARLTPARTKSFVVVEYDTDGVFRRLVEVYPRQCVTWPTDLDCHYGELVVMQKLLGVSLDDLAPNQTTGSASHQRLGTESGS